MKKQTLSDQFFDASQRFHTERHLYEAKRENLKVLEADLLKYTDEYQEMPKQVEYVGEGTWRVFGSTFSAMQRDCECCWDYVCNTFSGNGVSFPEPWRSLRVTPWPTGGTRRRPRTTPCTKPPLKKDATRKTEATQFS